MLDASYIDFISKFASPKPSPQKPVTLSAIAAPIHASSKEKPANDAAQQQQTSDESSNDDQDEDTTTNHQERPVGAEKEEEEEETAQATTVATKESDFTRSLSGEALKLFNEIYTCCATNNVSKLKQIFADGDESRRILVESLLNKRLNAELGFCLLHLTSQLGFAECITLLLLNGADPSLADLTRQRRVPYFLSLNKPTRDAYRKQDPTQISTIYHFQNGFYLSSLCWDLAFINRKIVKHKSSFKLFDEFP